MNPKLFINFIIFLLFLGIVLNEALFIVREDQQVVITQFGQPVGKTITNAGLNLKIPLIQKINKFDKRILEWDGQPNQMPTKDKKYIQVDITARWKIINAIKFLKQIITLENAFKTLDNYLDTDTRTIIANHNLEEVIRSTNDIIKNAANSQEEFHEANKTIKHSTRADKLGRIKSGRQDITKKIIESAKKRLINYGIELVDVKIKRVNYEKKVEVQVYRRMISERKKISEQLRAEGRSYKARIEGDLNHDLLKIESQAYKKSQKIIGKAESESIQIYAKSYNKNPEFYSFMKTLETYQNTFSKKTTLMLNTENEYFKLLKSSEN